MTHAFAHLLRSFSAGSGQRARFYSLPVLSREFAGVARMPVSLRIVLESMVRHCDGHKVLPEQVRQLAQWMPHAPRVDEIPFRVARVVLQDFTGVPLLADLAAMRSAAVRRGHNPVVIEPQVPVDLVIDHSVMVDHYGTREALDLNMQLEFHRNHERYEFIKWGMQAFDRLAVVPPGFGIVHQINLEHLARGVHCDQEGVYYPDTLVGTDSHTTMINGIGVVGWGVGGIEGEAAMLGQPVYFLTPDVVGVELTGQWRDGCTVTDLVLTVTELLRTHQVVGKFVEFFGEGARGLSAPDRATLANMAPEYGATLGFFSPDDQTLAYFKATGRSPQQMAAFKAYFQAQGLWGIPQPGDIDYSQVVRLDLGRIVPSLAGPARPQDRIEIGHVAQRFRAWAGLPAADAASQAHAAGLLTAAPDAAPAIETGDVLIAAITSCTNTSNPGVMLAAGLLARKAVQAGLKVPTHVKTSLAPGSRVVTDYLDRAGLLPDLQALGFSVVGYGCTTCIGNSGDFSPWISEALDRSKPVCAAVLSGNRNFEARIHPRVQANFLASPPLVVAYALAGTVLRDLMTEPVGWKPDGQPVWLGDLWPTRQEIEACMPHALQGRAYQQLYAQLHTQPGTLWERVSCRPGPTYDWPESTYIAQPPFLEGFDLGPPPADAPVRVQGARVLALLGDSITTDHISPAGAIDPHSPAGQWLQAQGVKPVDFNSYGARRGHHEVMVRGTLANPRLRNFMLPVRPDGTREEGGFTLHHDAHGQARKMPIYDAAQTYLAEDRPTVIFAGEDYGSGSSRDWAAKGTRLLGVRAVIARSFERIHRANLVGMGVLPLQWRGEDSWQSLGLDGSEWIDVVPDPQLRPQSEALLEIVRANGHRHEVRVTLRIDTPIEATYYRNGGILPFVLGQLLLA